MRISCPPVPGNLEWIKCSLHELKLLTTIPSNSPEDPIEPNGPRAETDRQEEQERQVRGRQ